MAIKWQGMEKLVATISNAHPKAVEQSLKVLKNNGEKNVKIFLPLLLSVYRYDILTITIIFMIVSKGFRSVDIML